jgi:hypothetical protein
MVKTTPVSSVSTLAASQMAGSNVAGKAQKSAGASATSRDDSSREQANGHYCAPNLSFAPSNHEYL